MKTRVPNPFSGPKKVKTNIRPVKVAKAPAVKPIKVHMPKLSKFRSR